MKLKAAAPDLPLWKRLLWFGAIWAGGVLTLGLIAAVIRFVLRP
ncbi:DUF2474 family protein [Rhizorhapis suberifaciens]|uniref:DUF2474 domain-containing protein n=1 Tax=Rhizorhapis suberifaciens TaxID=13656 RepID=A0A840HXU1_9SPHN|nr:DUF2474 family protein [Rhizorhapis suberifaciens]MBB4642417.1 hypothetical protein [Rhizorhapis suberifaciens]